MCGVFVVQRLDGEELAHWRVANGSRVGLSCHSLASCSRNFEILSKVVTWSAHSKAIPSPSTSFYNLRRNSLLHLAIIRHFHASVNRHLRPLQYSDPTHFLPLPVAKFILTLYATWNLVTVYYCIILKLSQCFQIINVCATNVESNAIIKNINFSRCIIIIAGSLSIKWNVTTSNLKIFTY